jgi:hypothetical protein
MNIFNGEDPRKKSFKYYNPPNKPLEKTVLKLNRRYLSPDTTRSSLSILVFFEDGFLNLHTTQIGYSINCLRRESGVTMGYYKVTNDSIFFTTKSYYQQYRPTKYRGRIAGNGDTLYLEVKIPKWKEYRKRIYVSE